MRTRFIKYIHLVTLFLLSALSPLSHAADEAEFTVWTFPNIGTSWSGNGPLPRGTWPIKDKAMRLPVKADTNSPLVISKNETIIPADQVNVIQIRLDGASATKCQFSFTTGASAKQSPQKMVEFDLKPGTGVQNYTLDLKSLPSWKDSIASLQFSLIGAKPGEELSVEWIKALVGDKISQPMLYSEFRPGQKSEIKEFRLGALFSSDMVLQRGKPVPVWGRAKPGETVTVEFAGQKKSGVADSQGKWQVLLDSMEAQDKPQILTATGSEGAHRIELTNVLVGDVWLCGGQSNMGSCPLENLPPGELRKELVDTAYPNLRYVTMPGLHRDTPASNDLNEDTLDWRQAEGTSKGMPAVGYYFGQAIHASQKVPVGLLFTIKAGSQVEQWLDKSTLNNIFTPSEFNQVCGKRLASGLFNGMVAPIMPFPIRGAMWYQGESNADNESLYMGYYKSLPALIQMWRSMWGENLPVFLAQLPRNETYPLDSWAHIREVQFLCATRLPNIGMAVSFDEGDPKNLHPNNKYYIGTRLGLAARALAYGENLEGSSPIFKLVEKKGNALEVLFEHAGSGLEFRGEPTGFEIRSNGGEWVPASAQIAGKDKLVLSSPAVNAPEAVRYAWGNSIPATLFSKEGLPASPYRSDTPTELIDKVTSSSAIFSKNKK